MTADPLPENARSFYTMWIRRKNTPSPHWKLHAYGNLLWVAEMIRWQDDELPNEWVILEPGMSPMLLVDVPYHDEGGES